MEQLNLFNNPMVNINKIQVNLIEFYFHVHNIIESKERKHFACHILLSNQNCEKNIIMPLHYNHTNFENEIYIYLSKRLQGDFFDLYSCTAADIFESPFIKSNIKISVSNDVFEFSKLTDKINKKYLENIFKLKGV